MAAAQILFTAVDTQGNDCLFGTDSATGETRKLATFAGSNITIVGTQKGQALLTVQAATGTTSLWCWNGQTASQLLSQGDPGRFLSLTSDRTLFTVKDDSGSFRLWITDGTVAGTQLVRTDLTPQLLVPLPSGKALCIAGDSSNVSSLWITDGTESGTTRLQESGASPTRFSNFTRLDNGRILFMANDPEHGTALWVTDGTSVGTHLVSDVTSGLGNWPFYSLINPIGNGKAMLRLGNTLWCTDGTSTGTVAVTRDLADRDIILNPTALGDGRAMFVIQGAGTPIQGGYQIPAQTWITDGTQAGTRLLNTTSLQSYLTAQAPAASNFTLLGNGRIIFSNTDSQGTEPWTSDGTVAGTARLADLSRGPRPVMDPRGGFIALLDMSSSPASFLALKNGSAIFSAGSWGDPKTPSGAHLWLTDGRTVTLLNGSTPGQSPASLLAPTVLPDGRIAFVSSSLNAENSTVRQLWVTDGTAAGTRLLADLGSTALGIDLSDFDSSIQALALLNSNISASPTEGNDLLTGTPAADRLDGLGGDDRLRGLAGNDTLIGGRGADTLEGGAGNDTYEVDSTADVVSELANEGTDLVKSAVSWTLGAHVEQLLLTGGAIAATGNTLDNTLTGNAAANVLDGGLGADTMAGGAGDDTYVVDNAKDTVTEAINAGTDTVQSSISWTLGKNLENLTLTGAAAINATGNELANVLTGNAGANVLDGKAGADTMIGGLGDDTYVVDNAKDVITETVDGGIDTVRTTLAWTLSDNLEHLTLLDKATNATGNSAANRLTGNAAANILDGKAGADTMIGGAGNDTYYIDNVGDVVTELSGGGTDAVVTTLASWTLSAEVEALTLAGTAACSATGNALANTLTGNAAANVLDGGLGADTMAGGLGDDTYVVDNIKDTVNEAVNAGIDTVQSSLSWTLGKNLENLTLTGVAAINATGNELANVLQGNAAANTLNGGAGNDTYLIGRGSGADLIQDSDTKAGNVDTVRFLYGIATDQLWFRKVGSNLEVSIIGTADKATIDSWYTNAKFRVEQFQTSGGKTLAIGKVDALVSAMAGLTPPAMGQTTLSTDYQTRLSDALAKSWS